MNALLHLHQVVMSKLDSHQIGNLLLALYKELVYRQGNPGYGRHVIVIKRQAGSRCSYRLEKTYQLIYRTGLEKAGRHGCYHISSNSLRMGCQLGTLNLRHATYMHYHFQFSLGCLHPFFRNSLSFFCCQRNGFSRRATNKHSRHTFLLHQKLCIRPDHLQI